MLSVPLKLPDNKDIFFRIVDPSFDKEIIYRIICSYYHCGDLIAPDPEGGAMNIIYAQFGKGDFTESYLVSVNSELSSVCTLQWARYTNLALAFNIQTGDVHLVIYNISGEESIVLRGLIGFLSSVLPHKK